MNAGEPGGAVQPASDRDIRQYKEDPVLSSQFPVRLPDGRPMDELKTSCSGCGKPLPDANFRGRVAEIFGIVSIDSIGYCESCNRFNRVRIRFKKGGVYETVNAQGQWVRRLRPDLESLGRVQRIRRWWRVNSRILLANKLVVLAYLVLASVGVYVVFFR